MGQHTPGTTTSQDVVNGVDDFSHIHPADTASSFGWRNEWFQDKPLGIGQITGVRLPAHAPIMPERGQMCSLYITSKTPS